MLCLELSYCKNYLNLSKILFLKLFKLVANQSAPSLNRGLSSKFRWLRNANHVKFTEECVISMEKHVLGKKCL